MSSANPITVSFPKPTLTVIATTTQAPTYSTISIAQRELNGKDASIHSNGGNGRNGHLSQIPLPIISLSRTVFPSFHQQIHLSTQIIQWLRQVPKSPKSTAATNKTRPSSKPTTQLTRPYETKSLRPSHLSTSEPFTIRSQDSET